MRKKIKSPYSNQERMNEMTKSTLSTVLHKDIKTVWEIVTSLDNYTWRSDLNNLEVIEEGKQFVEYTKDGFATTFTITHFEPMKLYAFTMENNNMKGSWSGIFEEVSDGVKIVFTEDVIAKKIFIKPFVKAYLKKQQSSYCNDLHAYMENL